MVGGVQPPIDWATDFRQLIKNYSSNDQIRELSLEAKENAEYNALPCEKELENPGHR
jgi:hypothetical protein